MNCPFCGFAEDKVVESRPARDGAAIRRRRECLRCNRRYTTFEQLENRLPAVVKKDSRREAFDRAKIVSSMEIACRKRPVPTALLRTTAEDMERALMDGGEAEVSSQEIGDMVLDALHHIDPVAFVRFASVYKEFEDTREFREIVSFVDRRKRKPVGGKTQG
ncbi:MAG: transcriptional regulator NrdR [Armatimonadota bacterium]|nr:transcriptional regulator NrdR [Armatimonadota bacterium]